MTVNGFVSALSRAFAHAHYFSRYLTVRFKIRTIGSNIVVALAGSLVWKDSLKESVVQWDVPRQLN